MDKIRYSSFKFKVWEDRFFKIEKQKLHLEDIKLTHRQETDLSDNEVKIEEQKINNFPPGFTHKLQSSASSSYLPNRKTESYKH